MGSAFLRNADVKPQDQMKAKHSGELLDEDRIASPEDFAKLRGPS